MNEIKKIIEQSLKDLNLNDGILINRFTKEEAINHWLAIYIDKNVKNNLKVKYNVDVEYNRNVTTDFIDGNRQIYNKKIIKWTENNLSWKEIIPDIIVHKRGSNKLNYLCIEAKKKYINNDTANEDLNKILGLLAPPYNYKYGCTIEYLPEEDYFEIFIIKKAKQDYEYEHILLNK
jgi:hypothetical protein